MDEFIKYVGLDVHGKTIAVAVADTRSSEVRFMGQIANTAEAMVKLVNQLKNVANDGVNNGRVRLSFCYEAGPCGYGIHRQLTALTHECQVIAPSLIPKKAGIASRPTAAMRSCWLGCTVLMNSPRFGCLIVSTKRCATSPAPAAT
jgi:transposase